MPFEYTPYRSPFTGAIADLIGRQGDIAAQQALNEAKARTQAVSGVAQSLGNLAQYQADAPKRELERMRIAAARQDMLDAQESKSAARSLSQLMSPDYAQGFQPEGPSLTDETGVLPKGPSLVQNIGGVKQLNPDAIASEMARLGHGAWFLEHRNKIDELNKSMVERHVLGQTAVRSASDLYTQADRKASETGDDKLRVQSAYALFEALKGTGIIPSEDESLIEKALGVGDVRPIARYAQQYATPEKVERVSVGPGTTSIGVSSRTGLAIPGTEISGPKPQETTAQYNARVDAAFGTPEDQRTAEQQQLVDGVTSRAKALEATKRLPLNDEHVALLEKQKNGTLTPEETVRLSALDARAKLIPQFNVTNRQERLVQLRRFDPEIGTNVIEFVPESEARRRGPYRAPIGSAEVSRKHTATALTQTGDDVIKSLQSPTLAKQLGVVMGRYNTLEDFIGNPPPEFARLAGELKSFSAANMTVHGFRSSTGAQKVFEMLNQKQTPEALIEKIKGLMQFTKYYLNEFGDTDTDASDDDPLGLGPAPR